MNIGNIGHICLDVRRYYKVNIISGTSKPEYNFVDVYQIQSIFETMISTQAHLIML